MLEKARSLGDELVIVLSSDSHNKKPYAVPAQMRLKWLQDLKIADSVRVGEENSFAESLLKEKPDILVLGYDQKFPDEETERLVKSLGIEVVRLPWFEGKEEVVFTVK